jgi:hypothetical protein
VELPPLRPLRLVAPLAAVAAGLVLAGNATAAPAPTTTTAETTVPGSFDAAQEQLLSQDEAVRRTLDHPKVADWLERYPPDPQTEATFDAATGNWTVKAWSGEAGQIVLATVDDATGDVTEAWTGPQVAWSMARGGDGAFGGRQINSVPVWLVFCIAFFLGLADLRRPLSMRNLDLLVLLSFSVSLYYFNRGDIFTSVPLAYPPLVYLLGRLAWMGARGRSLQPSVPVWPVWVLAGAVVFLAGFRIGLNVEDSNVIDVGYASVVGAHRIANGQAPYGNFPTGDTSLEACGAPDAEGNIDLRRQTNGRCEHAVPTGDTYGPVTYLGYLPGFLLFGWGGEWVGDPLYAAHFTAIAFDLLCMLGLALVGLRFGGLRLAATLAFAWVAYPFTQYVSSSNANDSLAPAFLIWGFWLVTSPWARGVFSALAGWTKFFSLIVAPLWLTYPDVRQLRTTAPRFVAGFALATVAAFSMLLLEPDLIDTARLFFERTVESQVTRESPFSLWDWGQYHAAGIPDLAAVQLGLEGLLLVGALVVAFVPRRKSPLQLAALTGALLIGFELVLTHWFYLYIPWFFPFAAIALLAAAPAAETLPAAEEARPDRHSPELVPAG